MQEDWGRVGEWGALGQCWPRQRAAGAQKPETVRGEVVLGHGRCELLLPPRSPQTEASKRKELMGPHPYLMLTQVRDEEP